MIRLMKNPSREFGKDFGLTDDMGSDEVRQEEKVLPTIDIEGLKHIRVNTAVRAKSSLKRCRRPTKAITTGATDRSAS